MCWILHFYYIYFILLYSVLFIFQVKALQYHSSMLDWELLHVSLKTDSSVLVFVLNLLPNQFWGIYFLFIPQRLEYRMDKVYCLICSILLITGRQIYLWKRNTTLNLKSIISLLPSILQSTDYKPVPLKAGEDEDYMLALKQEMRGTMQRLPHNIKPQRSKAGEVEVSDEKHLTEMQWEDNWLLWVKLMQHLGTETFH